MSVQVPGDVEDVAGVLAPALARAPSRIALVDARRRYTFGELESAVNRAAHALRALGVSAGERVAACLPNRAEIVIAFLATQRLGALWVGIAKPLAPPEKRYLLEDSGARVYLVSRDRLDEARSIAAPHVQHIIEVGADDDSDTWSRLLAAAPDDALRCDIDPHAPAAIAYTSGTTGFPKGAIHSQHNLILMGAIARACGFYPPDMAHGVMLPLTTLNLMVLVPLLTLQNGATCVVLDAKKAHELSQKVAEHRIGHFTAVPAIYHDLFTSPEVSPRDLASLVQPEMGGANIPPVLRDIYRERFGREICVGYGMTEAPATVTRTRADAMFSPGLCGHPLPQYELEILDAEGSSLGAGEVGEICIRGTRSGPFAGMYTPMLGYWNKPDATREVLRDGRYHSGDLGMLDEQGQLFVMGRKKELIIRGGANIYPAEVERVLCEQPGVVAAAVLGIPDERLGERVIAYLELAPGQHLDVSAMRARLESQLARYKLPEELHQVSSMPRNAMGKIVKPELLRSQLR
jgi:long-chain acyl-CoA synthetase